MKSNKENCDKVRFRKNMLKGTFDDFSVISKYDYTPTKPEKEHESPEGIVNIKYNEEEENLDDLSPTPDNENISYVSRKISIKNMTQKNQNGANMMSNETDESFLEIDPSEIASMPTMPNGNNMHTKPVDKNMISQFKGAALKGLTNFNYFLTDAGVMGLMGVKKLDFEDRANPVTMFGQEYVDYQKGKFQSEFERLLWFTYRNDFEGLLNRKDFLNIKNFGSENNKEIKHKILSSDNGWGCMIRVAQMIIARVLCLLEEDSKINVINENYFDVRSSLASVCDIQQEIDDEANSKRKIIKLFLDNLRDQDAPFSIQNFVEHGFVRYKKYPGDWYGANSAAIILEDLNTSFKPRPDLEVIVFNDTGIQQKKCYERAKIKCTCASKDAEKDKDIEFEVIEDINNPHVSIISKYISL